MKTQEQLECEVEDAARLGLSLREMLTNIDKMAESIAASVSEAIRYSSDAYEGQLERLHVKALNCRASRRLVLDKLMDEAA